MRAHRLVVVGAVFLVILPTVPASAQAPDPWIGTWKLNTARSNDSPGPSPKNGRIELTAVKGGIHQTNRTDPLAGPSTTSEITAMFDDGKTRTTTQTGSDAQGRTVNHTIVYEQM